MSGPRKRRKQREARQLEKQIEGASQGRREATGAFWVLNRQTGEKTPNLSLKQAKELWRSLESSCYFEMDTYTPGRAPLRATYLDGPIPG